MKIWVIFYLILILFSSPAQAGELAQRLESFPQWQNKPSVAIPQGELIYPDWMEGTWEVTSTLTQQVAPLAPDIVTPGFEQNQHYLNQPVKFTVRFKRDYLPNLNTSPLPSVLPKQIPIIPDRAFNGLNIAQAYLGVDKVSKVKVNPTNPNEQITFLPNQNQLITKVTGRSTETLPNQVFITTEISQQIFRGQKQIYLNEVETTTAYQLLESGKIEGDQITAIYLSSQDPNYFTAINRPVALYRYHLELILLPLTKNK
jgi:hypothetical protein